MWQALGEMQAFVVITATVRKQSLPFAHTHAQLPAVDSQRVSPDAHLQLSSRTSNSRGLKQKDVADSDALQNVFACPIKSAPSSPLSGNEKPFLYVSFTLT